VFQGLIDIYVDQRQINPLLSWEDFKDQFVIILVADGYKNLKKEFLDEAEKLGIFDYASMKPFVKVYDYSGTQKI